MFSILRRANSILRLGNLTRGPLQNTPVLNSNAWLCTPSNSTQEPDIAAITDGDPKLEHKLKILILEVDVMRQDGNLVPEYTFLTTEHWKELLTLETYSARRRFLQFLFKISKKKENRKLKKAQRLEEFLDSKPERNKEETYEEFASTYDLSHNNIFLRFYESTINQMYNNRLVQAMQFGQKLVVDCGYDNDMTSRENSNCGKQLMLLFAENRMHDDPFDLHYCNINRESHLLKTLHKYIGTLYEPSFPLNLHEESYLDKFPKEQLVYLTPHCREELREYDHDAVYIIGAIVDKVNNQPLSLAKAKREGLKMAKLPLDRYLQWGSGSGKSLTLNQVASILLDVKTTGDWKYALRHVPRRKIVDIATQSTKRPRKVWTPSKNEFSSLKFGKKDEKRERNVRSLLYD